MALSLDSGTIAAIVLSMTKAATPLTFAALGELVTEKSGVLNLGVEGMMLVGALGAFITTIATGSAILGILAAILLGAAMAALFALLTLKLMTNQVATGLALTIFGVGLSAFLGRNTTGLTLVPLPSVNLGPLSAIPLIGPIVFGEDPLVYVSLALAAAVWWFLYKARPGLILRAVGESPSAAHAIGYPVLLIRFAAVIFGGACCGLGGAYLSLVYTPMWVEGMSAGRGWIALALVVFSTWRPGRVVLGAYLFGGVTILQLQLQAAGIQIPAEAMSALPYLATIVVLVLISRNEALIRLNAPASLGKIFHT